MPAISTNDLKNGITLQLDNGLFKVVDFQHVKPGKGGAFVRTTLQERPHRRRARPHVQRRRAGRAGDRRQAGHAVPLPRRRRLRLHGQRDLRPAARAAGGARATPPTTWSSRRRPSWPCSRARSSASRSPASVELTIAETEPGVQGDRVSGARKPATLETGLVIQVPLFVNPGDRVKVDTRTGEYITRV